MATKIDNFSVLNFSGGVRRDKSPFELKRNELSDARNLEIEEFGRLKVRRGSQQVGNTLTGNIENSFVFQRFDAGATPTFSLIVNNNAATSVVSILRHARITANVAVADTTITVDSTTNFASPTGTIEIDGDLITYTGTTATTFTGASGITSIHTAGAAVLQWSTLTQSGTAMDGRDGIYYGTLANTLVMNARLGNFKQYDGTSITDITGEPAGLFLTNYRDRLYVAGDNTAGTNGDPRRVSFSNRGSGTSWTTASDFFDIEDQEGQMISGFKVNQNILWIFKPTFIYSYDEIELIPRQFGIGAWNHRVIQRIDNLMYTFCPEGIFETTGGQSRDIGQPVKQFWKNFRPRFSTSGRVVTNTFSAKFEHRYLLYIFDITDPTSTNDVILEYDTIKKAWTIHEGGFTNFQHLISFDAFRFGDGSVGQQYRPALFGGNDSGQYFRFFENRYVDSTSTDRGSDIFVDLRSNTGTPVSALAETPLYDLTHPYLYKEFRNFRGYAERGVWNVEYRVVQNGLIGPYRKLGSIDKVMKVLPFPAEAEGTHVGFRIANVSSDNAAIFNGFILEDTIVVRKDA